MLLQSSNLDNIAVVISIFNYYLLKSFGFISFLVVYQY